MSTFSLPAITFGGYLRLLRRRARLTQSELSIAVGYSEGQISRLETGRRPPDLPTLIALFCPALGIAPQGEEGKQLLALAEAARAVGVTPSPQSEDKATQAESVPPSGSLIGRGAERGLLRELLVGQGVRLVTLLGTAGVGKTTLAGQMVVDLAADFADGVWLVALDTLTAGEEVAAAVAHQLGVVPEGEEGVEELLLAQWQGKQMLLILDNVEQIEGMAGVVQGWLAGVPRLQLLLTSRRALRLAAEHLLPLEPLAVPSLAPLPPLMELAQVEAMALLLARLRRTQPDLVLTAHNVLPLAAICVRVDGLPLALELVAAHGRLFSPQQLLAQIAHRFLQMEQRVEDVPYRHRTAVAALTWSYEQLPPLAQRVLGRLAVLGGGWRLGLATAVCDVEQRGEGAVQQTLHILLDHSLLQAQVVEGEETRLTMLTMVREFALHQLRGWEKEEEEAIYGRVLAHLTDWVESAAPFLLGGYQQRVWLGRLAAEEDNLRQMLRWAASHQPRAGARLAAGLWRYWYVRGHLRDGRQWAELFLPHLPPSDFVRVELLDGAAVLAWRQADYATAEAWVAEALLLCQPRGDARKEAQLLSHMGLIASTQAKVAQAQAHYAASLPLYEAVQDVAGMASVLHNLGNLACEQNDNETAERYYRHCLAVYEELGDESGMALVALGLGVIAREADDPVTAHAWFSQSRALAEKVGDGWNVATAEINLGELAMEAGNWTLARAYLAGALAHFELVGDQQSICMVQGRLGQVAWRAGEMATAVGWWRHQLLLAHGLAYQPGLVEAWEGLAGCGVATQPAVAVQLLAVAERVRGEIGRVLAPAEALAYGEVLDLTRAALAPAMWAQAWAKGGEMGVGAAVAVALRVGG